MSTDAAYTPGRDVIDATCLVCPAQLLPFGLFDVAERPGYESRYDPTRGYRVNDATGAPTCVHPYRVGLPPGLYATVGEPLPDDPAGELPIPDDALVLSDDPTLLEAWLIAVLRSRRTNEMASALAQAEAIAMSRFDHTDVVAAMRRVLSNELPRLQSQTETVSSNVRE